MRHMVGLTPTRGFLPLQVQQRALALVANAGLSRGFRSWHSVAEAALEHRAKLAAALHSFLPAGRAKRAVLNSWKALGAEFALMRRAGAALGNKPLLLGWNTWAEFAGGTREMHNP